MKFLANSTQGNESENSFQTTLLTLFLNFDLVVHDMLACQLKSYQI